MSSEQKYKENDGPFQSFEASNRSEILIFTDKQQVYKVRAADFADTKASVLGVYLPSQLKMDEGENVLSDAGGGKIVDLFHLMGVCCNVLDGKPVHILTCHKVREPLEGAVIGGLKASRSIG